MANSSSTSLIIYASAFCIVAMILGAHGAPAAQPNGELDADEREVIVGLAESIIRVAGTGLDARPMGKRSNAELVNGLLGMRLGELARAGRR